MTNPPDLTESVKAIEAFSRQIGDAFGEMVFQLGAQASLGVLLRGLPLDQVRAGLDRRTTEQLQRINRAARQLTTITDGLLEDREADQLAVEIDAAHAAEDEDRQQVRQLRLAAEKARLSGDRDRGDKFATAADDHERDECTAGDEPCVAVDDARQYLAAQNAEASNG